MDKKEIPIMFCFDNNYVIPAAVAFYSLLENASNEYYYKMYVLHTDISEENQQKLKENISKFSYCSELIFINMKNKFEDLWETISTKGHFSKEVMYKVLVASIFPMYDKIIVSDVDVVFLNDISESYFMIEPEEPYYLAGVKMIGKMQYYLEQLSNKFTKEEIEKLNGFCGGYIVFNLKRLREDKMEEKFIKCFETEGYRINQMEQDILNLCCYGKTKRMPLKYLACSYMWDKYKNENDKETDSVYSKKEIDEAMNNTVQLHYATSIKPWKNVDCTKGEEWFKYLAKTNYLNEYLKTLPNKIVLPQERIEQLNNENKKNIYNEILEKVKKESSIKFKINKKFGKNILFRFMKYCIKNPLFLFKKDFYKKIKSKIMKRIKKQDFSLVVFDDVFPSVYSPFRYEEYMEYFENINSVYVFSTGTSLKALNEQRTLEDVILEFEEKYPKLKGRVFTLNAENVEKLKYIKNKIAIVTFLQNLINPIYNNLELFEKYQIPFIFTLYPGGGFKLNDNESDEKLEKICKSKFFKKVIVTQKNTYEYLLKKNICNVEKMEFIYGVVTPKRILENCENEKKYYKKNKEVLDICFVAHKYSKNGIDKGYDLFIDVAKTLAKQHDDIRFHVIGGFDENEIDVTDIKGKIKFYGILTSEKLKELYKKMDIILSPNRPFVLSKGSFDGFPTGSCTEAMANGVALICTDELNLNVKFKSGKDLIIVRPEVDDIIEQINKLYDNPKRICKISSNGRRKTRKIYSKNKQIKPRVKLIKRIAKECYKY